MTKRNIIIDTDPGIDDAIALFLAMASPELNILGITAVAGNIPLTLTYRNALEITRIAGQSIPVFSGCDAPLQKTLHTAEAFHGIGGLGDYQVVSNVPDHSDYHGVDFIIEQCLAHKHNPITLCAMGPLTNIAMAIQRCPTIRHGIRKIVMMGGALQVPGNTTQEAEFNVFVDPLAAQIVLASELPVVMAPLDVTHQTCLPCSWLPELDATDSLVAQAMADMLRFSFRDGGDSKMHDACVIAWLLQPDLFEYQKSFVSVDLSVEHEGNTVADYSEQGFVTALLTVNQDAFLNLLKERIASYQ